MLAKLARNHSKSLSVKLPTLIWDSKEPCSALYAYAEEKNQPNIHDKTFL